MSTKIYLASVTDYDEVLFRGAFSTREKMYAAVAAYCRGREEGLPEDDKEAVAVFFLNNEPDAEFDWEELFLDEEHNG